MDNIQFWIYIIFAVIYFLSRSLRKKTKEQNQEQPESPLETETQQPVSFEELLEEITGRRSLKEQPKEQPQSVKREEVEKEEKKWDPQTSPIEAQFNEGTTRRFSDEESRRIYEESIKRAEGFDIEYKPDEKFASKKVLRSTAEVEEENKFAKGIKSMLQNPESAKKAVILAEILNRKY